VHIYLKNNPANFDDDDDDDDNNNDNNK